MTRHTRALLWLVFATVLWAISFPIFKALLNHQQILVPGIDGWHTASLSLVVRFVGSAIFLVFVCGRDLLRLRREEWHQGLGLGFFSGTGLLLQMDGLGYTAASTSAFLSQFYCIVIPAWACFLNRELPTKTLVVSCLGVVVGAAILSGLGPEGLHFGRGEIETLGASMMFAGQILWVEKARYAKNRVLCSTFIMFLVIAVFMTPLAIYTSPSLATSIRLYSTSFAWAMNVVLTLACTVGSYWIMNTWQRHVSASEAGLLYCVEPIFASGLAFVLPGWLSIWGGMNYPNEVLTRHLFAGAALILGANILLQWRGHRDRIPKGQSS